MKRSILPNKKKLAGYSAMAAAFIAAGTEAEAQIVYVDIVDVTLDLGFYSPLDLDGDGTDDFLFQVASDSAASWSFVNGFGNYSGLAIGGPNNAMVGYDGVFFPYASAMDSGNIVDAAANFITNSVNYAFFASIYSGSTYGPWADVTDKYLGVKFEIDGALHYGWIRLDVSVAPVSMTFKDWAYNATPNEMITAGDTGVLPSEISFADAAVTVNEGVGSVPITIEISEANDCTIGVEIDGGITTALEGEDFVYIDPSPIVFTAGGPTTATFDVSIFDDVEFEIPEFIAFNLVDITGTCMLGAITTHVVTVNDNDAPPAINFVGADIETAEIAGTIPITVIISESFDCTVEVELDDVLTTASEGSDFTYSVDSPIVFINGGPTSYTFDVTIIDDIDYETTEDIVFNLTSVTGCILGVPAQTAIHILENDIPTPDPSQIEFTLVSELATESDEVFTVGITIDVPNDCTVDAVLNTASSTATNGEDFNFVSPTTLTFITGGSTTQEFTFMLEDDLTLEADETIVFELTNVTGNCELVGSGDEMTITIIDNDQVGIETMEDAGIQLFSSGNSLFVSLPTSPNQETILQLVDATGKIVLSENITSKEQTFTLNSIAEGIYITRIFMDGKSYQKKIWLGK